MPLLSETSLQAQILIPLVLSIVSGLLITTILVLLVIPALYCILDDFALTGKLESSDSDDEQNVPETGRMAADA